MEIHACLSLTLSVHIAICMFDTWNLPHICDMICYHQLLCQLIFRLNTVSNKTFTGEWKKSTTKKIKVTNNNPQLLEIADLYNTVRDMLASVPVSKYEEELLHKMEFALPVIKAWIQRCDVQEGQQPPSWQ